MVDTKSNSSMEVHSFESRTSIFESDEIQGLTTVLMDVESRKSLDSCKKTLSTTDLCMHLKLRYEDYWKMISFAIWPTDFAWNDGSIFSHYARAR